MKPQKGEDVSLWYAGRSKSKPLKKSRRHSPVPLLYPCQIWWSPFSCISMSERNSFWGPDSVTGLLALSGCLLVKTFYAVSWGWPPCLHDLATTSALVTEEDKLTLRQELTVQVPHSVLTLIEYKGNYWLTNSQVVKYSSMIRESNASS
jgi:hypothetical protein